MSYGNDLRIEPTPAVTSPAPVRPVHQEAHAADHVEHRPARDAHTAAAATTGGTLRAAYAQYDVNPDTNDVVLRNRDATTDQYLNGDASQAEARRA